MAVDDVLDFSPNYTQNTLQTSSSIANIIINSLLLFLILIYINIIVSKLVYFTRFETFSYLGWVRAYVFTNSDDLVRILSWLLGRYTFKESHWKTHPNKLQWRRLLIPMLARAFIVTVSLISIAVTIEEERVFDGCQRGDYVLTFNPQNANLDRARRARAICTTIPLASKLGEPNGTAAYCSCVTQSPITGDSITYMTTALLLTFQPGMEFMLLGIMKQGVYTIETSYIEWKPGNTTNKVFRTRLSTSIEIQKLFDAIQTWFEADYSNCGESMPVNLGDENAFAAIYPCTPEVDSLEIMNRLQSRIMASMTWVRTDVVQERLNLDLYAPASDSHGMINAQCMVSVIVTRPLVNMVLLGLIVVGLMMFNLIISAFVSQHDNALDAGFHVVKESLGHDTTSNPLEKCEGREELMNLEFKQWECGHGGYHAGYLRRLGDMEVNDFDSSMIVCGCAIVQQENERTQALPVAPVASSESDSSEVSSHVQQVSGECSA